MNRVQRVAFRVAGVAAIAELVLDGSLQIRATEWPRLDLATCCPVSSEDERMQQLADFEGLLSRYQAAVIDHYSQPERSFTITADLDAAVKREIQNLPETDWQDYRTAEGIATDRQIVDGAAIVGCVDDRGCLGGKASEILRQGEAGDVDIGW